VSKLCVALFIDNKMLCIFAQMMEINRGQQLELEISQLAFGGKGVAKLTSDAGEYVVFVENTFPGQKVKARVTKKKKKYAECTLIEILQRSPLEEKIDFQLISGAPYLYVPIELQLTYKKAGVLDLFKRIAHFSSIETIFDELIPSPAIFNYRNKMEYSFSSIEHDITTGKEIDNAFALGFKHRGTWWKVENLNHESGLFDAEWETKLKELRIYLKKSGLKAWHPPKKEGFFRHIVVRKSFYQNQLLINLVTSSDGIEQFDIEKFGQFLKRLFGKRIAGFQHTINDNVADRAKIENGSNHLIFGESVLLEKLNNLYFEISMESFFQTNPQSAEMLYQKALDYVFENANLKGKVVMDLFCGTGTIGQMLAKGANDIEIIGVDIVQEAIDDAQRNAARNHIQNIQFFAADVGKFLKEFPAYQGKISTIVLDPPRAGIAPKTLQKVIDLKADRLVYISCNPATQARDTETLMQNAYIPKKLSLVDQFPHTSHIETVMLFEKVGN
jgi:23S rRNA (uracil-5-)-methyltransferase RumA